MADVNVNKSVNDAVKGVQNQTSNVTHDVKSAAASAGAEAKTLLDQGKDVARDAADRVTEFAGEARDRVHTLASHCHDDFCEAHSATKVVVGVLAGLAAFGIAHFVLSRVFGGSSDDCCDYGDGTFARRR